MTTHDGWMQRLVRVFLTGHLSPLLLLVSLAAGAIALLATPREEDPQIVVPVAEILVTAPGASALEVERQITIPIERVVQGISGVEDVYSTSSRGQAIVTARFFVGENREDSLVKLHTTLQQHAAAMPPQVRSWRIDTISIDDVPILAITLHSDRVDDHGLRRMAEELVARLQQVPDAGPATIHGGRTRTLAVHVDATALAGRGATFAAIERALAAASVATTAGSGTHGDRTVVVEAAPIAPDARALRELVIGIRGGQPVHLGDVASVTDGPEEPRSYVWMLGGSASGRANADPENAVTIAIAKRRGANAVTTAERLRERMAELAPELLSADVRWTVTRDSGATADGKVDELLEGLLVAVAIVVVLITMMLGWRAAVVVAVAVPITFGLTLLVNELFGYSINRVTLFALILSLGLVVDDPIVDVENIHRHLQRRDRPPLQAVLDAVDEVRPPVIVATLAVVLSFLPLFFITGMMGPYMRPMALNVPVAMAMSMLVAFTLTPWLSHLLLRSAPHGGDSAHDAHPIVQRIYASLVRPLLRSRATRLSTVAITALLFVGTGWLGATRAVPLKMLPFDNKTELQVLVDLDEGSTLERTDAVVRELGEHVRRFAEVTEVTAYAGTSSPLDFNGMVRKYHLRRAPELGELRVGLLPKFQRRHQSHEVALRIRDLLGPLARECNATVKVVELPPGPPVLATVVAEVRGPEDASPAELDSAAQVVAQRLSNEPGVVDVDTSAEAAPPEVRYEIDHEKAALHGVDAATTAAVLRTAVGGTIATHLHEARELVAPPVEVRLPAAQRVDPTALGSLAVPTTDGQLVALAEIGRFTRATREGTIHRKNLVRVAWVTAEAAGRPPAEIVLDVEADRYEHEPLPLASPRSLDSRSMLRNGGGHPWRLPHGFRVDWRSEGEWKITLDAFRDLGLAFFAACFAIYVLLVHETKSYVLPIVLMLSIPFTILGILPGFWLLNVLFDHPVAGVANPVFFTATAMIGMIALSGIAVRNSIILIDFVQGAQRRGASLEEAILQSGAVRLRPIVLTAGAAILASIPITLDPIFSGLAWALIFGLVVSSAFTLVLVPVAFFVTQRRRS